MVDRAQTVGDSNVSPVLQNATPGDGRSLLEHSGWLDRVKSATGSALHTAQDLGQKGLQKGKEIAHSAPVQGVIHDMEITGQDIAKKNVEAARGTAEAARRGDVNGVIAHAAPLVEEAALGPHGAAAKIIKDEAVKTIREHAQDAAREQVHKKISGSHSSQPSHNGDATATAPPQTAVQHGSKF